MEYDKFLEIRADLCLKHADVTEGKMMSSPAIHYRKKVFAFFSKQDKMVFRLSKIHPVEVHELKLSEFNPFKNKGPMTGWYEADSNQLEKWQTLSEMALNLMKNQ